MTMDSKTNFAAALPAVGGARVTSTASEVTSPKPPLMLDLTPAESDLYEQICETLRLAGIEHLTASIPITVIVRTLADWHAARAECAEKGRFQTSKTGWSTDAPWYADEKRLKMELGQWLPKACLTIPSLARVRKDTGEKSGQDDLFSDLVKHANHATTLPAPASRH